MTRGQRKGPQGNANGAHAGRIRAGRECFPHRLPSHPLSHLSLLCGKEIGFGGLCACGWTGTTTTTLTIILHGAVTSLPRMTSREERPSSGWLAPRRLPRLLPSPLSRSCGFGAFYLLCWRAAKFEVKLFLCANLGGRKTGSGVFY